MENAQYLAHVSDYLERWARVAGAASEYEVLEPFTGAFEAVNKALSELEAEPERTWQTHLQFTRTLLDALKLGDADTALLSASENIAATLVGAFSDSVLKVFHSDRSLPLQARYRLTVDQRVTQEAKIVGIVQNFLRPSMVKLKELEHKRYWLDTNFHAYATLPGEELDITRLAKGFGLGALAVANPLIGVPALIGTWLSDTKQEKAGATQDVLYETTMKEFIDGIEVFRQLLLKASEQTRVYIEEKWREVIGIGVPAMLKAAVEVGEDIQNYVSNEDLQELTHLEVDFGIKEAQT